MLSYALSRDENEARDLKSLAKGLLDAIVEAIEAGNWEAPPASVEGTYRGRRLSWRRAAQAAPPCPECSGDRVGYVPDGEGMPFDFCPACWALRGGDAARSVSFDVRRGLEKKRRDLPPGLTMKLRLGDERLPVGPAAPASEAERAAALEAYVASAVRPLEIGRQVWMGRMTFEGMNGVPRDFAASRRWFERAAAWGSGEALTALGLMALRGLGGPADAAKAVALCRRGAERGFPGAQTGMGHLCWDGTGVPRDREAAFAWWGRAARQGDEEARRLLVEAADAGLEAARALVAELGLGA